MVGKYIVIEGLDMCGKTTMQNKLNKELRNKGHDVLVVSEPYIDDDSRDIMNILLNASSNEIKINALAENRNYLLKTKIIPALESGVTVLSSRSFISSLVYQSDNEFTMSDILKTNIDLCADGNKDNFIAPNTIIYMPIDYNTYLERTKIRGAIDTIEFKLKSKDYFDMMTDRYLKALAFTIFHVSGIKHIIIDTCIDDVLKVLL